MIPLLLLPLLPAPAPQDGASDVALFVGPPGGAGEVVTVAEDGLAPPQPVAGLDGVRLLDVDAAGRSAWTALLPDRPRRRTDVAGGARILLPNGAGSLYRFRRDEPRGATFGFFHVAANGATAVVLEVGGHGAAGDLDPFVERVGVDAAGTGVLVATVPGAGGDLFELDLAAGTAVERTAGLPPLDLLPAGGRLLPTWGVAVAQEGLVRFDRAPGAQAALVAITDVAAPAWWDGGVVVSADGSMAATVAGASPTAAHVICLGASGAAHPLDATPQHLSGAGFDAAGGPYLGLSTDGSTASWRTHVVVEGQPSREAWLGPTTAAAAGPVQLTADGKFIDTLDETGLVGFVSGTRMLFGVGELADPGVPGSTHIDGMDLYLAELQTDGTTTIQNLSLTSGDTTPPFVEGLLRTEEGVFRMPNGDALARVRDQDLIARIQLDTPGFQPVVTQNEELLEVERAGDRVLFRAIQQGLGAPQQVFAYDPATGGAQALGGLPSLAEVTRYATGADARVAFVVSFLGNEWMVRADLVSGFVQLPTGVPLVYGPAVARTAGLGIALTVGAPAAAAFPLVWTAPGGVVLLPLAPAPAQVLPGAS